MKQLAFHFEAALALSQPAAQHVFALRCLPAACDTQQILQLQAVVEPGTALFCQRDGFGSTMLCGTLNAPHTSFRYRCTGVARVDYALRRSCPPEQAMPYRSPGALTAPDAALRAWLAGLAPALAGCPPEAQARLLCGAVHDRLAYVPGATARDTTAARALALGRGVCQDYTHVFLALARLAGLTVRYCMGLTPGEGATHAWAEVLLPDGWHGYDPTRGCETDESWLRFAAGRDAADCPPERGVFRGGGSQKQTLHMALREV